MNLSVDIQVATVVGLFMHTATGLTLKTIVYFVHCGQLQVIIFYILFCSFLSSF